MDVWVVAAAAGAGYVAQRLKSLAKSNRTRSNLSSESSIIRHKARDKSCPLGIVLSRKKNREEMYKEREKTCEEDYSTKEMASTSAFECENLVMVENFGSCSSLSNSSSLDGFLKHEDFQGDLEGGIVPSDIDEVNIQPSSREMGFSYGFRRNRSGSLRSRRINTRLVKPQTSLESCLMAQLYKEHAEIEEYTYCLRSPQEPTLRPFLVTDGRRIISKAPRESFSEQNGSGKVRLGKDTFSQENNAVIGVPRLPNVVHMELKKKTKARKGKGNEHDLRRIESGKMANGYHNNPQGSSDRDLLFYHGLSMGIIASFMANKQEVDKLNTLLKQTENLVQDLQDELEMKYSLTVKELATEDYESRDVDNYRYFDDALVAISLEQKLDDPSRYCNEVYSDQKAGEESLSKIEAELEAELERLESNMNSSRLKSKVSNVAELDPDLDVIEGELRADLFGAKTNNQPYADRDGSGTHTPCSVHYPVSPRELSLRLHEVIQSRLEERVKELEDALHNSQRKVKYIESSCTPDSPFARNGQRPVDPPVVINLSGEALASYSEAYEEFAKSDEEDLRFGFENGGVNGNREMAEDGYTMSDDMLLCGSNGESEDEMERLLIKQIIEKAKQGSPAVLKAQRALLLNDECEY